VQHHRIHYIELSAPDLTVVEAFYAAAFGWTFQHWGEGYISFEGAGLDGGIAKAQPLCGDGAPLVILYSDDLSGSVAAVEKAGGKIVAPIFAYPGGKRFHFRDPAGNVLAVWGEPEEA
jgi:predicted enzyme related to lactoylglutathione lyase